MSALDRLSDEYLRRYPTSAARVLEALPAAEVAALLAAQEPQAAAAVLEAMAPALARSTLAALEVEPAAAIAQALPVAQEVLLLRRLAPAERDAILAALPAAEAATCRGLLAYPPGSAGALMDPTALWLPEDVTAGAAEEAIRRDRDRMPPYLYLIERGGRLTGVVDPLELRGAEPDSPVAPLMRPAVEWLAVADPRDRVIAHAGWRELRALPVVDDTHRLVGVVSRDTVSRLRGEAGPGAHPISLTLSLAELFWLGVAGMTDGFAQVTGGGREPGPAPGPGGATR